MICLRLMLSDSESRITTRALAEASLSVISQSSDRRV